MVFIQLVDHTAYKMDEYECGWELNYDTYPVRDRNNSLVCLYRKNIFPYNIKGGTKV